MPLPQIRIVTYNIHQGITARRNRVSLSALKDALLELEPDVVVLQEVAGKLRGPEAERFPLEIFAHEKWPHCAYGRNAHFSGHYHGNAILSRYPITHWTNEKITVGELEPRGILHGRIAIPSHDEPLHVLGIHLGLSQRERHQQVGRLCRYAASTVSTEAPLFIAGDFNDWRRQLCHPLFRELSVVEAHASHHDRLARTFPSRFPMLALDRIYYRGSRPRAVRCLSGRPWQRLSDHLPIVADFVLA
jgi:endonuclease/exonuclease/phosphatase family metal-dependent hydrolase